MIVRFDSRGLFGAISGAGEAIRGTINGGLDGLGDGVSPFFPLFCTLNDLVD